MVIKGRDDFYINGVSARTVGIVVDAIQPPPMAQQRHTVWSTGIDADSYQDDDVFDAVEYTIPARVLCNPNDFGNTALYAYLQAAKTLELPKVSERYYKVLAVAGIIPKATVHGNEVSYDIMMTLAPFKYHTSNGEIAPTDGKITNPGTRYSRPVWKLTHSGGCTLTVNGDTLTVDSGASSPIWIDATRMLAYDGEGTNQTKYTTGQFPFLQPGINNVSTTGITVTVVGNWRDY